MNRATVNKIFQKHPVYVKAGMIAVISIIIFGCVYSKDNGKKLEKDEKGREILRRNESGKDELKNMKVKIDEKQEDISISVSGKKYDEEELKNAFSEAEKEVEQAVLGKNKSLDEVRSDLNLITSVPEKNMKVSWELDRYDVSVSYYRKISNKVMAEETRKSRQKMDDILRHIINQWDGYEVVE